MSRRSFTETWIRNLSSPAKGFTPFKEVGRRGFLLRAYAGGSKVFFYQYSWNGKPEFLKLREWTPDSNALADAHKAHAAALDLYLRGINPKEERERSAREREAVKRKEVHKSGTVGKLYDEWMARYVQRERKRPEQVRQAFEANVLPKWRERPAREITKRDVVELLDRVVDRGKPVMANRVYSMLRQCFEFGVARDLLDASPIAGVEKPGGTEHARERTLTTDEIKAFWAALDSEDEKIEVSRPVRLGLKLILVTAQRPGEVAGAMWTEIDTAAALWIIPAARSKNGKPHQVPLSDLALKIIAELREAAKDRPRLLPSWQSNLKPDEPLSVRALSRALRNNHDDDGKLFGCEPFTPHDLRRTAASFMTRLGIPRLHVEKLLNHTTADVAEVYDRHDYGPEKKRAVQVWVDELRAIIAGEKRRVVPLREGRAA